MNGQVLPCDYTLEEARIVMHEMLDASILELVQKGLVSESISLSIGYVQPKGVPVSPQPYHFYAHTGGTRKIGRRTNSAYVLKQHFENLFNETTRDDLLIKRISIGFGNLLPEKYATVTLFDDVESEAKERRRQEAIIAVRKRFGKNSMLKGTSLQEKATARERNNQIGGHRA